MNSKTQKDPVKGTQRTFGQFDITYFDSPMGDDILDETYVKAAVDLGFTKCPLQKVSAQNAKIALGLFKKYGLSCNALQDDRIHKVLQERRKDVTQAEVDAIVKEVVQDFAEFDNLDGFHLWDEPEASHFPLIGMFVDAFHRLAPQYSTYINLFPTYAGKGVGTENFERYIQKFLDIVDPDSLSYDHYHFCDDGTARPGFFTNIEYIRDASLASGKEAMLIVLVTHHGNYADLTRVQLNWEVNMCMVYGFKRASYYQFYMLPEHLEKGWDNCMIDSNRKIYPHYYDVKAINQWLLPLGRELYGKKSTAVFHVPGTVDLEPGCRLYAPYGDLSEIEGQDLVIGFFDDGSFMIVNKKFESEDLTRTVVFKDIKSGLQYFDPMADAWKDAEENGMAVRGEDGRFSATLQPGGGILFRVVHP